MIKYKAEMYYEPKIKKIEVERETACFVWIQGRKESKYSEYSRIHESFSDTKNYLICKIQDKIDYHECEAESLKQQRQKIEKLTPEDL